MADLNDKRVELAERLRRELASEHRLTPHQARAFVRGLQVSWQVPPIRWRESDSQTIFADARRLMHAAEIFRNALGHDTPQAKDCYRRAAELLEWLSRARDALRGIAPVELLAAAAFQLGGQPAMAFGLLGQIAAPDAGTRLYSKFLKADFDGVIREAASFWSEHLELTDRNAPARMLWHEASGSLGWCYTVELVRCIGLIAASLRQGEDDRLHRGLLKLRALDKTATSMFSNDVSLLVSLLRAVADGYQTASIYGPIRRMSQINPERTQRLLTFARDQFSRGRGILWSSQIHGLGRLLESSSFALCTPTGSGKTLVANLALMKELLLASDDVQAPLALYLVPSRALAGEVEAKLTSELGRDVIVTGLYGGTDWGITDYWLNAERPTVLIATVEKADALMRYVGPLLLARLRLLIVDEAHQVVAEDNDRVRTDFAEHRSRALRLEAFVSRLLARLPTIARIALTAVAGGAATPVARWIEGDMDAEPIGTNYRSTRQVIGTLESTPNSAGRMSLDLMNGEALQVSGREEPVYLPLRTPAMPRLPAAMRTSVRRFNELNVLWTALHLVDGDRRVLISVAQQPEQTMRWFKEALELPTWAPARRFEPPADPGLRSRFDEARATCVDYCGQESHELALLDCGIATSHGQMPQRLRRLMTELIDRRICPVTVATATLTEGVNLPFDMIFVTSLRRRSFTRGRRRSDVTPLSTAEFRNLAGRAGRPGATLGMEGMTLVALPTQPPSTAPAQIHTQRTQIREMRSDYDNLLAALRAEARPENAVASPLGLLLQTIAEQVATLYGVRGEAFLRWLEVVNPGDITNEAGTALNAPDARLADSVDELDGVLLTALEELAASEDRELALAETEEHLIGLWQRTFSSVAARQERWLERAFVRRGKGVVETVYPDPAERRRLYQYGFSPHVGRRFELIAPHIQQLIERAVGYGSTTRVERLAVFESIGAFMATDRGFGFRARDTETDAALLRNWPGVLAWWLQGTEAPSPEPADLRAWQRFVADNFEFRLGVSIGAVVAQAWAAGANDPLAVPSLDEWRETSGLPWFGFWARELLRWGTLDPFVAFALAQGMAGTRSEAAQRRHEFESWMENNYDDIGADDRIDPRNFLRWQRSLATRPEGPAQVRLIEARLTGTNGQRASYSVVPVLSGEAVHWIDPSGFELAISAASDDLEQRASCDDFELSSRRGNWRVHRTFRAP
ncbi:DEAD/DEAH box helicase [Burkholderia multivorans]|uniref:DEAD/DEAH box helicase n=1 Tax=Burkholderia multivorans TaxID=87883 RepID=UPI001C24F828|nr:DEAD/DEAH box helicase [Burkholderia multivorans]MBU9663869.1 DEAD/DEAH box helicase [Burkholderia multivorans]